MSRVGEGCGRSIAMRLAERKYQLVLLDSSADKLEEVSQQCRALGSPTVAAIQVDLCDTEKLEQLLPSELSKFNSIDG